MTTQDLYEHYRIMPELRLHQLRVAAVAKTVCDNSILELDTQSVVLACLFHDMANIIKSDFTVFPDFLEPLGVAHWQIVKDEFLAKYGKNEHKAADAIAKEIGLPENVRKLVAGIGFSRLGHIRDHEPYEQKIAEYADLRVGPHGVISMIARIEEAKGRYTGKHPDLPRSEETFEELVEAAHDIERQIFADSAVAPEDITEQSVLPLMAELRDLQIAC